MEKNDNAARAFPGQSELIQRFGASLRRFAEAPIHIHIWGEPGMGKHAAARCLSRGTANCPTPRIDLARCDEPMLASLLAQEAPDLVIVDRPEDIFANFQMVLLEQAKALSLPEPDPNAYQPNAVASVNMATNLLELRQIAQRVLLGLPQGTVDGSQLSLSDKLNAYEKSLIMQALQSNVGVTAAAAEQLGIPP